MCGILGVLGQTDPHLFESALHRLTHRGPDGYGIWEGDQVMLGHRRLAIIDISSRGKQPLEALDRYWITFNGEIYNYKEIREELEPEGFTFRGESDTEVLLYAYVKWKERCLDKLNGMWSFAIWDKQEQSLFLSRDRFGKKPLFYAWVGGLFVFASEMKAIYPFLPRVEVSSHFEWCKNHINDYEGTDKCLIEGISRFPAGHYGWVRGGQLRLTKFWDTLDHLPSIPHRYEEQVEQFRDLFIDACRIRMRSDVPIGTALSGGLDSSAVISTMAHIGKSLPDTTISDDWQHAFVATFPGTFMDESRYAQAVVDHLGISATFLEIDPTEGIKNLEDYLHVFEELHLTSPIPMVETYKAVRANGVRVTLDGHGADETIAGYGQDVFKAFQDCGMNLRQIRNILKTYRGLIDIDSTQIRKSRYNLGFYVRYMGGKAALAGFILRGLLGMNPKESIRENRFGVYNQHLYRLFHQTVLPTLLRNYDRYSMAHGVEIRMPFMDHRLVSFLFALPWSSKIRNGYTKAIVRDAVAPMMPGEVAYRTTKLGFNTPIVDWMQGPWKDYLLDTVHCTRFNHCSLINASEVRDKVQAVISGTDTTYMQGESAWAALTPYLWEKSVLGRENG